jgi:glycosyltransferase involved in cell wall biosynthesis
MRVIAIDGRILLRGPSGIARVAQQLGEALGAWADVRVVSPTWRRRRSSVANALHDTWWDLRGADRAAGAADLLISPCNIGAAARRPSVLHVADAMPIDHPERFERKFAAYFARLMPYSLRRATRVITNTAYVQRRLLALAPRADVRVLPLPAPRDRPQARFAAAKEVLVVGATEPHKNHGAAVAAVARVRERTGEDLRLHLVGPAGRGEAALGDALHRADPAGAWTTRHVAIADAALIARYASAWALLQPSLDEGYGLPLVEAAAHGLPAIHSGAGAMAEVAPYGDAHASDAEPLADALEALLDPATWERHAAAGRALARARSWDAFVRDLRAIVEPLLA